MQTPSLSTFLVPEKGRNSLRELQANENRKQEESPSSVQARVFRVQARVALFQLGVCSAQLSRALSSPSSVQARVALFHLQGEETFRRRIQGGDGWHGNASSWMAMHECFSLVFIGHNWSFFGLVVNMGSSDSPLCLAIWSLLTGPHCGAYSRETESHERESE